MEKVIKSSIQLSFRQAKAVINQYYPKHELFDTTLVGEKKLAKEEEIYRVERKSLLQILTAPIGTEYTCDLKVPNELEQTINTVISSKDTACFSESGETQIQTKIAYVFVKAKTFREFYKKFPFYIPKKDEKSEQ